MLPGGMRARRRARRTHRGRCRRPSRSRATDRRTRRSCSSASTISPVRPSPPTVAANQAAPLAGAADDLLAIGALQVERQHMVAERAAPVVVLAVHIVGDGAAHRDQARAGQHRQPPAARQEEVLDVAQHHARLAGQPAGRLVEGDEAIEAGRTPQGAAGIEAGIAIAAAEPVGDAGPGARQRARDGAPIGELDHVVRQRRQPAPGRHAPHGAAATRKTKRLSRWYFAQ